MTNPVEQRLKEPYRILEDLNASFLVKESNGDWWVLYDTPTPTVDRPKGRWNIEFPTHEATAHRLFSYKNSNLLVKWTESLFANPHRQVGLFVSAEEACIRHGAWAVVLDDDLCWYAYYGCVPHRRAGGWVFDKEGGSAHKIVGMAIIDDYECFINANIAVLSRKPTYE